MPENTEYSSKVYNALRDNLEGFNKTETEFKESLKDPNYVSNVHRALTDNLEGFNKSEDDFKIALGVTSPKQPTPSTSGAESGVPKFLAPTKSTESPFTFSSYDGSSGSKSQTQESNSPYSVTTLSYEKPKPKTQREYAKSIVDYNNLLNANQKSINNLGSKMTSLQNIIQNDDVKIPALHPELAAQKNKAYNEYINTKNEYQKLQASQQAISAKKAEIQGLITEDARKDVQERIENPFVANFFQSLSAGIDEAKTALIEVGLNDIIPQWMRADYDANNIVSEAKKLSENKKALIQKLEENAVVDESKAIAENEKRVELGQAPVRSYLGQTFGSLTPPLLLAGGMSAVGAEGALPLANGAFFGTLGYGAGLAEGYNEARKLGYNEEESYEIAKTTARINGTVQGTLGIIMGKTGEALNTKLNPYTKETTGNITKNMIKEGLAKFALTGVGTGTEFAGADIVKNVGEKYIQPEVFGEKDVFENAGKEFGSGLLLHVTTGAMHLPKEIVGKGSLVNAVSQAKTPEDVLNLTNTINDLKSNGQLTEGAATQMTEKLGKVRDALNVVPDAFRGETRDKAVDLIIRHDALQEKLKKTPDGLKPYVEDELKAVNSQFEDLRKEQLEKDKVAPKKYSSPTEERYGYVEENGQKVELTKEEFDNYEAPKFELSAENKSEPIELNVDTNIQPQVGQGENVGGVGNEAEATPSVEAEVKSEIPQQKIDETTKSEEAVVPSEEGASGEDTNVGKAEEEKGVVGENVVDNKTKQQLLDERLNKIKEIRDKAEGTREERIKRYNELINELGDETAALEKMREEINGRAKKEIDKLPELPKTQNEIINDKGQSDFKNIKKELGFKHTDYKWGKSPMDEDMGDMLLSKDKEAVIFIKPNEVEVYDEENDQTDSITNGIKIELVSTKENSRGKGKAKELIQKVTDWADKNGTDIYLDIAPQDATTTESGLKKLYEGFGFEFNGIHGKRKPTQESEVVSEVEKAPTESWDKDVESTAKALEGVDTEQIKKQLGIKANWDMTGETDALVGNDAILAYTQKHLPDWNRESQKGNINPNSKLTYDIVKGKFGGIDQKDVVEAKDENGTTVGIVKLDNKGGIEHIVVAPEFRKKGVSNKLIEKLKENNPNLNLSKTKLRSKGFEKAFSSKIISEAYHAAKKDGSNPELVKAVEDLLGKPTPQEGNDVVGKERAVLYHGGIKGIDDLKDNGSGIYLTPHEDIAKEYASIVNKNSKRNEPPMKPPYLPKEALDWSAEELQKYLEKTGYLDEAREAIRKNNIDNSDVYKYLNKSKKIFKQDLDGFNEIKNFAKKEIDEGYPNLEKYKKAFEEYYKTEDGYNSDLRKYTEHNSIDDIVKIVLEALSKYKYENFGYIEFANSFPIIKDFIDKNGYDAIEKLYDVKNEEPNKVYNYTLGNKKWEDLKKEVVIFNPKNIEKIIEKNKEGEPTSKSEPQPQSPILAEKPLSENKEVEKQGQEDIIGSLYKDEFNRTFEIKGDNAGVLTLEDVETGKILRKKKDDVLGNFQKIEKSEKLKDDDYFETINKIEKNKPLRKQDELNRIDLIDMPIGKMSKELFSKLYKVSIKYSKTNSNNTGFELKNKLGGSLWINPNDISFDTGKSLLPNDWIDVFVNKNKEKAIDFLHDYFSEIENKQQIEQNDKENKSGVQSNEREGQEPIETKPNESTSGKEAEASRDVQAQEKVTEQSKEIPTQQKQTVLDLEPHEQALYWAKKYNELPNKYKVLESGAKYMSEMQKLAKKHGFKVGLNKDRTVRILDSNGKQIKNKSVVRTKEDIELRKEAEDFRRRSLRLNPMSIKHGVALFLANGGRFDRKEVSRIMPTREGLGWFTAEKGGMKPEFFGEWLQNMGFNANVDEYGNPLSGAIDIINEIQDALDIYTTARKIKDVENIATEIAEEYNFVYENGGLTRSDVEHYKQKYEEQQAQEKYEQTMGWIDELSIDEKIKFSELQEQEREEYIKQLIKEHEDEENQFYESSKGDEQNDNGANAKELKATKRLESAKEELASKKATYEKLKTQLDKNGQQDQIDIFGKAKSEEMLFKNDIKEQEKQVADARREYEQAKENLDKAQAEYDIATSKEQAKIEFEAKEPTEQQQDYENIKNLKSNNAKSNAKTKFVEKNFDSVVAQMMLNNKIKRKC